MTYPDSDDDFEDKPIECVEKHDGTYTITCGGWSLWCGMESSVKPEPGQMARMYPRGIGQTLRGLVIDGEKIWYRNEGEQKDFSEVQLYGADANEWLTRWDQGDTCWTIEMGGLRPGYEQCIHIACAEILRWFVERECDATQWADPESWKAAREPMTRSVQKRKIIEILGLSGIQWGAAVHLAAKLYLDGPRALTHERLPTFLALRLAAHEDPRNEPVQDQLVGGDQARAGIPEAVRGRFGPEGRRPGRLQSVTSR